MHNWTGACHREKRAGDVCLAKGVAHENQKPRCTRNSLDAQSTSTRACMPLNRRCPLTVNWGKPFRGNTCVVCRVASRSMIRSPKQRKAGVANSCMHTTKHRTQPFPGEKMPAGVNSSMGSRTQRNHGVTPFYARTHARTASSIGDSPFKDPCIHDSFVGSFVQRKPRSSRIDVVIFRFI
mmetsp:Transcript_13795/g.31851  ORF Transcript_13795/g.31851 Transcript_13795/m.31851 type:complete len:180 (-) Transcript_13795:1279-1818(-)